MSLTLLILASFCFLSGQTFTAHKNFGTYISQSVAWGDYDNDGFIDVYISNGGENQSGALRWENYLYHNRGDGTFDSVSTGDPVTEVYASGGCSWGDYDNDGDLDLVLAEPSHRGSLPIYYSKNTFFRNDGGTFSNLTLSPVTDEKSSNLIGEGQARVAIGWVDYNNDGWLDLFESNGGFNEVFIEANSLFESNQAGGFTEISNNLTANETGRSGYSWVDFDNDGDSDLALASGKPNGETNIWVNTGTNFTKYTLIGSGGSTGRSAAGVSWADYDNDGDFDLFVAITRNENDENWDINRLYRNDTNTADTPVFTRMTSADVGSWIADSSITWASAWGDFDNDGDEDLFVGNDGPYLEGYSNFMVRNNGDGTFTKLDFGELNDSTFVESSAWGDYDNDGDLDLMTGREGKNVLFENSGNSNNWLKVLLKDTRSSTSTTAIGSRVEVYSPGKQIREVSGQTGRGAQNCLRQHFGLGSVSVVDSLVIRWLSNNGSKGRVRTAFATLPVNKMIVFAYGGLSATNQIIQNQNFMYLFGKTGAAVEFTNNGDADGGSITVQRHESSPTNNTFTGGSAAAPGGQVTPNVVANDRYWTISPSGLSSFTATVYVDITDLGGVNDPDKLVIVRRNDSNSDWEPLDTQRIGNTLYASGLTTFSEFTVGANSSDNSLPVELVSFTASATDKWIVLTWQTASEIENMGFIIERSTADEPFVEIASWRDNPMLKGKGNSSSMSQYTFTDENVENKKTYTYRLSDVSFGGLRTVLATITARTVPMISELVLFNSYPNPFNSSTMIRFQNPSARKVHLAIYNILGEKIKTLCNGRFDKGEHRFLWDGKDGRGQVVSSGIYLLRLEADGATRLKKLTFVR